MVMGMRCNLSRETKNQIIECLSLCSHYYPWEWINEFKHLLSMGEEVSSYNETWNTYFAIFKYAKEECESLLSIFPNSNNAADWREGIKELDKVLM